MDFEGDSFDPEEREDDDEYLETGMPTPYGFSPMAPFSAQQVHAVAAGKPLGEGLTHGYEGHRQPLPQLACRNALGDANALGDPLRQLAHEVPALAKPATESAHG